MPTKANKDVHMDKLAMIQSKVLAKKRVIKQNLKDWEKQYCLDHDCRMPNELWRSERHLNAFEATGIQFCPSEGMEHCQTRITGDWIMIIRQNLFWIQFAIMDSIDSGKFTKLLIQILSSNI